MALKFLSLKNLVTVSQIESDKCKKKPHGGLQSGIWIKLPKHAETQQHDCRVGQNPTHFILKPTQAPKEKLETGAS